MKIQFYMMDDTIISAGDCSREVYVIMEGEVRVVDITTDRHLATLG
jgi:CRP-like cAMP-binding protein